MDVDDLTQGVCEDAGVSTATSSADFVKALACVNRAFRKIAGDTKCIKELLVVTLDGDLSYKLSPNATDYPSANDLSDDFSSRFLSLDTVGIGTTGSSVSAPDFLLDRKPARDVIARQKQNATGTPSVYSCEGGILLLDGCPASGYDLYLYASLNAPTLTESSVSADILGIDESYHEEVLGRLATCILLEGWEGEEERAAYHRRLFNDDYAEFKRHLFREGGKLSQDYRLQDFRTPANLSR